MVADTVRDLVRVMAIALLHHWHKLEDTKAFCLQVHQKGIEEFQGENQIPSFLLLAWRKANAVGATTTFLSL